MGHLETLKSELSELKIKCDYWDVRVEDVFETAIDVINGEIVSCTSNPSLGAFVRVRKDGFWFYQSTTDLSALKSILTDLSSKEAFTKSKNNYIVEKQKPFTKMSFEARNYSRIGLAEKLAVCEGYKNQLKKVSYVGSANIRYRDIYKAKSFYNSVGTQFEFDFNQGGLAIRYTLKDGEHIFSDQFMLYGADIAALKKGSEELAKSLLESKKFLNAPAVKPGKYKVLLDPEVTGVFTHESFGHKSEADFMLGDPQALEDWKIGSQIGADCLTIVDYGGHENTSGYCPIDDDGILAQKNYLIKNGRLAGRLHTVDTASQLDEKPTGNSRAMNFEWEPMVRMTSTYIEPGTESVSDILARSEGAILVEGVSHGSGLSTFTIAPCRGYLIGKGGTKTPVRVAVISGSVFETLKNVEAVSSHFELHSSAIGGCGKMEQWPLPVADGGPFLLVREMQVS